MSRCSVSDLKVATSVWQLSEGSMETHALKALATVSGWPILRGLFAKTTASIIEEEDEDIAARLRSFTFRPDGWWADLVNKRLFVIEVEDTHPMSREKLRAYADMFITLDCIEWELLLIITDRYGKPQERPVDLFAHWVVFQREFGNRRSA